MIKKTLFIGFLIGILYWASWLYFLYGKWPVKFLEGLEIIFLPNIFITERVLQPNVGIATRLILLLIVALFWGGVGATIGFILGAIITGMRKI